MGKLFINNVYGALFAKWTNFLHYIYIYIYIYRSSNFTWNSPIPPGREDQEEDQDIDEDMEVLSK